MKDLLCNFIEITLQHGSTTDLVRFTEEILNGKLHFFALFSLTCSFLPKWSSLHIKEKNHFLIKINGQFLVPSIVVGLFHNFTHD